MFLENYELGISRLFLWISGYEDWGVFWGWSGKMSMDRDVGFYIYLKCFESYVDLVLKVFG